MYMRTFLIILQNVLKKDHPALELGFCFLKKQVRTHGLRCAFDENKKHSRDFN